MGIKTSSSPESTVLVVVAKIRGCRGAQAVVPITTKIVITKLKSALLAVIKDLLLNFLTLPMPRGISMI